MQAFLFIDLTTPASYHQPVLERVKAVLPKVSVLDLDAESDEMMQHYALRLLRNSGKLVVCIKADEGVTEIAVLMPFLEELFQENPDRLVLLLGHHTRLSRMFEARPEVNFKVVGEGEVVEETEKFLHSY
ncbi:hypothetical protein ACFSRY_04170 [Pontibacter locisalis]|uniref:Uncharacterized protein n=1 Tax=Pontibacter locisalis TaxID=1719035 RepID=A0ABW5IJ74_9BACT